ncbi:hypothetical protein LTR94_024139 [Friedmanniomyces endolithicus]|nr:hypothetical protein LTR94_024139 [Friedmanniomyces endolithicus]
MAVPRYSRERTPMRQALLHKTWVLRLSHIRPRTSHSKRSLFGTPSCPKTPPQAPAPGRAVDPSGWLYTLVGFNYGNPLEELGPSALTSLWGGQALTFPYTACSYTICGPYSTSSMLAASTVGSVGYLLATSTTTISSEASTNPAAAQSKASSSAQAEAVTNTQSSSANPTSSQAQPQQTSTPTVSSAPSVSSSAANTPSSSAGFTSSQAESQPLPRSSPVRRLRQPTHHHQPVEPPPKPHSRSHPLPQQQFHRQPGFLRHRVQPLR